MRAERGILSSGSWNLDVGIAYDSPAFRHYSFFTAPTIGHEVTQVELRNGGDPVLISRGGVARVSVCLIRRDTIARAIRKGSLLRVEVERYSSVALARPR